MFVSFANGVPCCVVVDLPHEDIFFCELYFVSIVTELSEREEWLFEGGEDCCSGSGMVQERGLGTFFSCRAGSLGTCVGCGEDVGMGQCVR